MDTAAPPSPTDAPEVPKEPTPRDLVAEAAKAKGRSDELTADEQSAALDWFLSDVADDEEVTKALELNVGTADDPRWITWVIRPVDLDTLRRIQRSAQGNRQQRRAGGAADEVAANARIIVEGTVDPDVKAASISKGIQDPSFYLANRFARKPGLMPQIAAEIMSLSGYDDEDVREVSAGKP